jgi:hypothetical protein
LMFGSEVSRGSGRSSSSPSNLLLHIGLLTLVDRNLSTRCSSMQLSMV